MAGVSSSQHCIITSKTKYRRFVRAVIAYQTDAVLGAQDEFSRRSPIACRPCAGGAISSCEFSGDCAAKEVVRSDRFQAKSQR